MAPAATEDGRLVPSGTLGFFACQVADRIVRVGAAEGLAKGPRVIDLDPCPACGNPHPRIKPHWRKPTSLDQGRGVEVVVDADGEVVS
jgi:hypothetical protein